MKNTLKIATRQSPLALWQANYIKTQLNTLYPKLEIQLVPMVTKGDVILDTPLAKIGGKGLFVKELERRITTKYRRYCGTFHERCTHAISRRARFSSNL